MRAIGLAVMVVLVSASAGTASGNGSLDDELLIVLPHKPVLVGAMLSLTGAPELGVPDTRGVQLALEDEGALGGHRLRFISKDDGCDGSPTSPAIQAAHDLAGADVLGVIGGNCSGATLLANAILAPRRITMFSPSATRTSFTQPPEPGQPDVRLPYFLRSSNDGLEGVVNAGYVKNDLGVGSLALIRDPDSVFADGAANDFAAAYQALGGVVSHDLDVRCVSHEPEACNPADLAAALATLGTAQPALIYLSLQSAQDAAALIVGLRDAVPSAQLFAGNGAFSDLTISLAGADAEGLFASGPLPMPDAFADRFVDRFGEAPGAYTAIAYDETRILLRAARQVTLKIGFGNGNSILLISRHLLYRKLVATAGYAGVMGTYNCNETPAFFRGDCINQVSINRVEDGAWVLWHVP